MEYNRRLISVYTSLRHSELLESNSLTNDSLVYFQTALNKSIPCTPPERLVFQTLRRPLKVSTQDSVSFITATKQWHLCLCAPIPVVRAILNVPDNVIIEYNKIQGYSISLRGAHDKENKSEEFPLLKSPKAGANAITNTPTDSPMQSARNKGEWIKVSKLSNLMQKKKSSQPRARKQGSPSTDAAQKTIVKKETIASPDVVSDTIASNQKWGDLDDESSGAENTVEI